jgi:hypothetical protein
MSENDKKIIIDERLLKKIKTIVGAPDGSDTYYEREVSIICDAKENKTDKTPEKNNSKKKKKKDKPTQYSIRIPRYIYDEVGIDYKKDNFVFRIIELTGSDDQEKFEFAVVAILHRGKNAE